MEFKPSNRSNRIESVDALRGFALLGIIIANIPYSPEFAISGQLDGVMNFLFHFLIDKKFISIFSILFGFGFYMQMQKAQTQQVHFVRYFIIRMLLLFGLGTIHAYAIWNGDILRSFALGGIGLLAVRNWPVKRLLVLAVVFCVLLTGIFYIGHSALGWSLYSYDLAILKEQPVTHSILDYLQINAITDPWTNFIIDMPITLSFTFGNMLIGVVMAKTNYFELPGKLENTTSILITLGISFGLAASYIYVQVVSGSLLLDLTLFWLPFVIIAGMILQSLFYLTLFIKLYQSSRMRKFLCLFSAVGRTALSNYILQSVFYVLAFYHCTGLLQLFGKLTDFQTWVVAILFFTLQLAVSHLCLKKHKQGPVEYLWKRISYKYAKTSRNIYKQLNN